MVSKELLELCRSFEWHVQTSDNLAQSAKVVQKNADRSRKEVFEKYELLKRLRIEELEKKLAEKKLGICSDTRHTTQKYDSLDQQNLGIYNQKDLRFLYREATSFSNDSNRDLKSERTKELFTLCKYHFPLEANRIWAGALFNLEGGPPNFQVEVFKKNEFDKDFTTAFSTVPLWFGIFEMPLKINSEDIEYKKRYSEKIFEYFDLPRLPLLLSKV